MNDGNYEDSMADLDRALKLVPYYNYALNQRGEVWRLKGEFDKAIVDFNAAIRADPDFLAAYLDRATAFKDMGNRKSARADYKAVLDLPGKGRAIDRWAKDRARTLLDELGADD
jgi:tetratricopeptide (TPR) repeat protein